MRESSGSRYVVSILSSEKVFNGFRQKCHRKWVRPVESDSLATAAEWGEQAVEQRE